MPSFVLVSAKGSPGVTTTAASLTAVAATVGRSLLVELDPSGGTLHALAGDAARPGLAELAPRVRRRAATLPVADHAVVLPEALPALLAPPAGEAAEAAIAAAGDRWLPALAGCGRYVVVDGGRWEPSQTTARRVGGADLVVVVCPSTPTGVESARHILARLREPASPAVAVIAVSDQPKAGEQLATELDVAVAGTIVWDQRGAARLWSDGASRRWLNSRLACSAAATLAGLLAITDTIAAGAPPEVRTYAPLQRAAGYLVGSLVMGVGPLAAPAGAGALAAGAPQAEISVPAPAGDPGDALTGDIAADPVRTLAPMILTGLADQGAGDTADPAGAMAPPAKLAPTVASAVSAHPPPPETATVAGTGTGAAAAAPGQLTVQPDDNFWTLAEAELAAAWGRAPSDAEVAGYWWSLIDQNRSRLLPPGDPDLIYPGQVFVAPAPPADPQRGTAPAPATPEAPGAADDGAGTGGGTDEEAGTGEGGGEDAGQAGGADTGANLGVEGIDGAEEAAATGTTAAPAPPTSAGTTVPDASAGDSDAGAPEATDEPAPATAAPGQARPGERGTERAEVADRSEDDSVPALGAGLVGGGLALAGVVLLLERRRRAQQRHRRPGRQVPMPPPPLQHAERILRHGADIEGARLLELTLRAAAAGSGAAGLPPLRWVEVRAAGVLLVLASPAPAPPGFAAIGRDRWLTIEDADGLAGLAARAAMPTPTLVPVGTTADGGELLIELEASGVVSVAGPPGETVSLVRALAVATATAPWADQSSVVLVGLRGELTDLTWVSPAGDLSSVLTRAEEHQDRTTSALWSARSQSTAQARAAGVTPEAWEPLVVVSALRPTEDERRRLTALADRPGSAVGIVVPAVEDAPPIGRVLTIGEDGWLRIDGVDVEVRPDRLDDQDAAIVVALLDIAARRDDVAGEEAGSEPPVRRPPPPAPQPSPEPSPAAAAEVAGKAPAPAPDPAVEAATPSPPAPVRRLDALTSDVDVLVRVLGDVDAIRRTGPTSGERLVPVRQKGLETIVYMAVRDSGIDREELESKLFPDGANAAKTVYNTVSAARSLVGDELFPAPADGRYELSERVVTDYGLFCELVGQADETDDAEEAAGLLTEALTLVRGEPFMGVGRNYAWVGGYRGMIVAQVIDAAEELAEIHLARNDWRSAEWAARRGLRAFPSDERMHRLLMRTARAAGNIPGVWRVYQELCDAIADPDLGVEPEDTLHPETLALLEELTGSPAKGRRMGA